MQELFDELVAEIRRTNPITAPALRPGLAPDVVREKLASLPFQISPDAVALYSWADGSNGKFEMLPGAYFCSLDEALLHFNIRYSAKDQLQGIFFEPHFDSFRFLEDFSDGGYSFGRIDSPSEGQIVSLEIHAPWTIAFRDLAALLRTSIECYRQGLLCPDLDTADFVRYYELAGRMNPDMEAWKNP